MLDNEREVVDDVFEAVQKITTDDGLLDHAVRAAEEYMIKNEMIYYCKSDGAKVTAKQFRIKKRAVRNSTANTFCYFNDKNNVAGATLSYPTESSVIETQLNSESGLSRNVRRFYIGHELGHLVLGHVPFSGGSTNTFCVEDKSLEEAATYYSMKLLQDRANFFRNSEKIKEFCLSNKEINGFAKVYHKDYSGGWL